MPVLSVETLLDDFAHRCFRDIADGDYIAARLACRGGFLPQYLWAGQQAVEKYLKCILLLHRIPATDVRHNLSAALRLLQGCQTVALDLTDRAREYIEYLDTYGRFRYLEISNAGEGRDIVLLDQTVWEIRRFCARPPLSVTLLDGSPAPRLRIAGGYLEKVLDGRPNFARAGLVWQNAFFGQRARRSVRVGGWARGVNAPLALHPQMIAEVTKYVHVPDAVLKYYRSDVRRKPPTATPHP